MTDEEWLAIETEALLMGPRVGMPVTRLPLPWENTKPARVGANVGRTGRVVDVVPESRSYAVVWGPDLDTSINRWLYDSEQFRPGGTVWVHRPDV